jgi:hypothetical protein
MTTTRTLKIDGIATAEQLLHANAIELWMCCSERPAYIGQWADGGTCRLCATCAWSFRAVPQGKVLEFPERAAFAVVRVLTLEDSDASHPILIDVRVSVWTTCLTARQVCSEGNARLEHDQAPNLRCVVHVIPPLDDDAPAEPVPATPVLAPEPGPFTVHYRVIIPGSTIGNTYSTRYAEDVTDDALHTLRHTLATEHGVHAQYVDMFNVRDHHADAWRPADHFDSRKVCQDCAWSQDRYSEALRSVRAAQ